MNLIKSIFVSSFFVVFTAAVVVGVLCISDGLFYSGTGALVAGGAWAVYFTRLYLWPVARNHPALPQWHVVAVLGAALSIEGGHPWAVALSWATVACGFGYAFWYSRLGRAPSKLAVGARLPAFTLYEGDAAVASDTLRSSLILFYRGNWCPLCMAQIREVADAYKSLADKGFDILLVSPQSAGHTASLAKRFDVPFRFLVDRENAAATTLGIAHEQGLPSGLQVFGYDSDTVLPTVIITDEAGVVRWTHETDNYRVRPEPEVFLQAIEGLA